MAATTEMDGQTANLWHDLKVCESGTGRISGPCRAANSTPITQGVDSVLYSVVEFEI